MNEEKYVVIDENDQPVNLILWNGDVSTWQPPENCTVKRLSEVDIASLYPKPESVIEPTE